MINVWIFTCILLALSGCTEDPAKNADIPMSATVTPAGNSKTGNTSNDPEPSSQKEIKKLRETKH